MTSAGRDLAGGLARLAVTAAVSAVTTVTTSGACGADDPVVDRGDAVVTELAASSALEGWAVNYPKQRKVLFVAGRLWLFYADGARMLARATVDGVTLGEPVVVRDEAPFGHRCGFASDGAVLHVTCCTALPGADVLYRRGVPDADGGAIAWDAEESVAFEVPDDRSVLYPKVLVDAGGRPWIGFMLFEGGFETAPQRAIVTRSRRTEGRWETDDGFPHALSGPSRETFPDPLGVALASGGTYWVWDPDGEDHYRGIEHRDPDGWGPEEQVSVGRHEHGLFDLVADRDDVHASVGGGTIRYRRRRAGRGWGDERVVSTSGSGHTSIAALGGGVARVTWLDRDGQRVIQREVSEGSSGPATLVLAAGDDDPLAGDLGINLNGLPAPAGRFRSAVTLSLGAAPPYRVVLVTR